jgi:SAM-dependent methyltransferase
MTTVSAYGAGPDQPSSARVHNLWLGGSWHTRADETKAAEVEAICPPIRQMAADSRLLTARTVGWAAAELGIGQYLELGAGVPHGETVHTMARSVLPGAKVAYVDIDPEVTDYLADVAPGGDGVALADLSRPAAVLAHPEVREAIDPAEPVCVLAMLVLMAWSPARARAIIRGYARRLAPGSVIAVSVPRVDDEITWGRLRKAYGVPAYNFTVAEAEDLLDGSQMVAPGVAAAFALRPGMFGAACRRRASSYVIGGIGRTR